MRINYLPFYLIIIALFIGIIATALFSDGMFMDGVLYAAISNNLANNLGSFWDIHLTNTLYPHFHEHPPLAFGIQSLFFSLFGESILIERFYSLITFLITGWIIIRIWKKISDSKFQNLAWLPLLFWILIPLVTWSAANNMLENTMMIFTSLSVLFILKSLDSKRLIFLSLSGIMLFLGFLTKGPVALFPISLPFWIFIFNRKINFKRFIIDTIFLSVATVIPLLIIYIITPESIDSLIAYFNKQIVGSIENIQTVNSRFYILWRLLNELIPAYILVLITFIFFKRNKVDNIKTKWVLVFFTLGLSGVIPIIVSMKQSGFYILATFPFFSIAIAAIVAPRVLQLTNRIDTQNKGYKIFKIISYLLLVGSIIFATMQIKRIGRDKDKINDVYSIIKIVPKKSTISVQENLWSDWSLHGYFQRHSFISLDPNMQSAHKYFLINKGTENELLKDYKKVAVDLELFDLYEKQEPPIEEANY